MRRARRAWRTTAPAGNTTAPPSSGRARAVSDSMPRCRKSATDCRETMPTRDRYASRTPVDAVRPGNDGATAHDQLIQAQRQRVVAAAVHPVQDLPVQRHGQRVGRALAGHRFPTICRTLPAPRHAIGHGARSYTRWRRCGVSCWGCRSPSSARSTQGCPAGTPWTSLFFSFWIHAKHNHKANSGFIYCAASPSS